ncbi:MAG TPA: hypothetical protein VFU15_13065 [Bacteroidia bacterium]|nr:hypothetical protein [Bacteroidia bacterium]
MKTFTSLCFLFLSSVSFSANIFSHDSSDANVPYFDITGRMTIADKSVADYSVILYCDGQRTDSVFVDTKKDIDIHLGYGHDYAVRFSKAGCKDRILLVDTHLPEGVSADYFSFLYSIEFLSEHAPSNTFDDFPVAYIGYDKTKKDFDYNRTYHKNIRVMPGHPETQTASR